MNIVDIKEAILGGRVRITDHADEEAANDNIEYDDIRFSVLNGEIIEDYPGDKPYPSCLVFGKGSSDEPVHSVWAYNEKNRWSVLITVYRPDPKRWIHWKERIRK